MQAQINLSKESELILLKIKLIAAQNKIQLNNKQEQINQGLEWLNELLIRLDDDDLKNILSIEK